MPTVKTTGPSHPRWPWGGRAARDGALATTGRLSKMLLEVGSHLATARKSLPRDPDTAKERLADAADCLLLFSAELQEMRELLGSIILDDPPDDPPDGTADRSARSAVHTAD